MGARTALASALLIAQAQLGLDVGQSLLPAEVTCEDAWRAERSSGALGTDDGPYNSRGTLVFTRKHHGDNATVVYMCQGGAVAHRLINMQFQTKEAASATFERHRADLTQQLGTPCWDPSRLSPEQQSLMGNARLSELGLLQHRNEWNARPGVNLALTLFEPRRGRENWVVTITVNDLASNIRSTSNDLPDKLYRMSTCEKGALESSSDYALERTRAR